MIRNERTLNNYFNKGKFNYPSEIGYVMNEIRKSSPITLNEWRLYYFKNVRTKEHLEGIALKMFNSMPDFHKKNYSVEICYEYVEDVIFRRTFEGFNKENQALKLMRKLLQVNVELSPKEWDGEYFIDFVIREPLIGIQLKPNTFYTGGYDKIVKIDDKLKAFEIDFKAKTFIVIYEKIDDRIKIVNQEIIEEIKKTLL